MTVLDRIIVTLCLSTSHWIKCTAAWYRTSNSRIKLRILLSCWKCPDHPSSSKDTQDIKTSKTQTPVLTALTLTSQCTLD